MDKWRYVRTAETYCGMDLETGKPVTYEVYSCPQCGLEVTDAMIESHDMKYCFRCGNRNELERK